jgi:hypothetical protein
MAGIKQGFVICPTVIDESGIERPTRKQVALVDKPTFIKSVWFEADKHNEKSVGIGDASLKHAYSPMLAPGERKEFIFKHDSKESPGDLADFRVSLSKEGDMITYIAITV